MTREADGRAASKKALRRLMRREIRRTQAQARLEARLDALEQQVWHLRFAAALRAEMEKA